MTDRTLFNPRLAVGGETRCKAFDVDGGLLSLVVLCTWVKSRDVVYDVVV
ncbi:hypothetical protein [Mycobacterium gordonae]|nr:hypothetical protein [Mycobacterium gordonae]